MPKFAKFVSLAAMAGCAVLSQPAGAATVITPVSVQGGTLDLANPLGTISAILLSVGKTYDFTFETGGGSFNTLAQVQASILTEPAAVPEPISFDLYNGAPGSGTFVTSAALALGPTLEAILQSGDHYIEITTITANMELLSGSLEIAPPSQGSNQPQSAAPESSTWVIMMVGFGLLGGLLRSKYIPFSPLKTD